MVAPVLRRCLAPGMLLFLLFIGSPAVAAEVRVPASAPGDEAVEPAAAFPVGRIDPVPVASPQCDPLFDDDCEEGPSHDVYDPFEPGNRAVYQFNRKVDHYFFRPVTDVYRFVVPDVARRSVRRAFLNLNAPIYVVNNLLQLRFVDAAQTIGAFAMNMTFGFGGLFNTADGIRCELKYADFGQTLALAGVGTGPYLMVPVLGPTTTRDGIGWIVDRAFHPLTYVLAIPVQLMWGGGHGVAYREEVADGLEALEESAVDSYAVIRSAYAQAREQAIAEARGESVEQPHVGGEPLAQANHF